MATGQKISAQTVATTWSGTDQATIVQSGVNKSITHDVFMDDTQICKAWVNFNGTGTVAITDDFNVSSITDNGTGDYTLNLTNAMSNANYSVSGNGGNSGASSAETNMNLVTLLTTSCEIRLDNTEGTSVDRDTICVQIFGS